MDCNPQAPQFVSQSLLDTPELGRRTEANLSDPADSPDYGLAALGVVAEPSVDEQTRQRAAVNFKTRWTSSSATRKIKAQFSEALGNHDFPQFWPALLPGLESSLEKNDFASVNGILATVNSLFKRFRFRCEFNSFKSNPVVSDLIYCSDNFAAPLLSTVKSISREINASVGSVTTLRQLLEAGRLCCRIFYSLNFFHVPENFQDKADEWMDEFKKYLTVATEDGDCLSLVDDLGAAVSENLILYMEKREGLLQKHLSDFVEAVCSLLVVATASQRLTVSGIKFLSIVSKSSVELFGGHDLLQQIIIPNIMLRDEDEELFEKNCVEFIKRDMEGNGVDTRRRNACELLKGISGKYKEKITEEIHNCLQLSAENPVANWKYKECAIYMVVSLSTTHHVVDVESFFKSDIVPELQCQDVNKTFPMLKAAALKFFTVLRVSIPKHAAMPVIGDVVRYLRSDVGVVCSYAAICIKKLLLVKDDKIGRYTSMDIGPVFPYLMFNLFGALEKVRFLAAKEKESMMRCIGRVLQMVDKSPKMVSHCITYLTETLTWVYYDPTNPVFNHLVFEAVATLVRRECEKDPVHVTGFQTWILDIFWRITDGQVTELYPYACQLLAQLVDLNTPPPLPPLYMQILDDTLLGPALWDDSANIPALVHLLRSFLQQAPHELLNRLTRVVGKINKLVSSPDTEEEGFRLLNTVIENYEYGVIADYMNHIWGSVFDRLHNSKTPRLVRFFITSMSLFLVKHGFQTLVDLIDSVEPKLFNVILGEFWIPNLKTITGYTEVKLSAVASTKLLYESASLLDPAAEELWGKLLDAIVTLLSLPLPEEETADDDDDDDDDEPILTDYQGFKSVWLKNVGKKEEVDPLDEIEDPKKFLVGFPENISSEFRGRFPLVLTKYLSPPNQATLVKLCSSYNISMI